MIHLLIPIDCQKDFTTGALANEEAIKQIPNIIREINSGKYDKILCTKDTHYSDYLHTQEGKYLPVPHCISGTPGHELHADIENALCKSDIPFTIVEKETFGLYNLPTKILTFCKGKPDSITFVGFCTDICVISNALLIKSIFTETTVNVIADCCAGVTPAKHGAALEVMRSCQINVIENPCDDITGTWHLEEANPISLPKGDEFVEVPRYDIVLERPPFKTIVSSVSKQDLVNLRNTICT